MSKTPDTTTTSTHRPTDDSTTDTTRTETAERVRIPCFLQLCSSESDATLDHPHRGKVRVCSRHAKKIPARLPGAEVIR